MKYLKVFDTTPEYNAFKLTENFILPNVSCTMDDLTVVYYNPYVAPIVQQHDYVEIGGVKWATMNVGAKTITDFGQKFSWGGVNGYTNDQVTGSYHAFSWTDYELGDGGSAAANMTKYNSTDGKTVLESVDDAATVNMGSGWRMPTSAEFEALCDATTSAWTADYEGSGVAGLVLTSKADTSIKLFFPAAGNCGDGSVYDVGSIGSYWSRSLNTFSRQGAYYMTFYSSSVYCSSNLSRDLGYSVRGVLDE